MQTLSCEAAGPRTKPGRFSSTVLSPQCLRVKWAGGVALGKVGGGDISVPVGKVLLQK